MIPALTVQIQGQGSVSADQLNTGVQWAQTVTQLRAFVGLPTMAVYLQGLTSVNDGGQGMFYWQVSVSQPDDGMNYIIPPGAASGGWVRFGPNLVLPIPVVSGDLSAVTDANAKAVMTSIIAALVGLGLVTNGTI